MLSNRIQNKRMCGSYRDRGGGRDTPVTNDQETRVRASWATCCQRGLGEFKLPAFDLLEPGVLPLRVYLAKDRAVQRGMRGLTTGRFPVALRCHRFDHRRTVHRGPGLAKHLRSRVEG